MAAAEVALSGCTRVVMYDGVCNACNRLVVCICEFYLLGAFVRLFCSKSR